MEQQNIRVGNHGVLVEVPTEEEYIMKVISKERLVALLDVAEREIGSQITYDTVEVEGDYFMWGIRLFTNRGEVSVQDIFPNIEMIYEGICEDEYVILISVSGGKNE